MQWTRRMTRCGASLGVLLLLPAAAWAQDSVPQLPQFDPNADNLAVISQIGAMNSASIRQRHVVPGPAAGPLSYGPPSSPNTASILQEGSHNEAAIAQHGSNNAAAVGQHGSSLNADVTQTGNNLSLQLRQIGVGNGLPVTIRQY